MDTKVSTLQPLTRKLGQVGALYCNNEAGVESSKNARHGGGLVVNATVGCVCVSQGQVENAVRPKSWACQTGAMN